MFGMGHLLMGHFRCTKHHSNQNDPLGKSNVVLLLMVGQRKVSRPPVNIQNSTEKNWKANKHMGFANSNVLPTEMFGRMERDNHSIPLLPDAVAGCTKQGCLMQLVG